MRTFHIAHTYHTVDNSDIWEQHIKTESKEEYFRLKSLDRIMFFSNSISSTEWNVLTHAEATLGYDGLVELANNMVGKFISWNILCAVAHGWNEQDILYDYLSSLYEQKCYEAEKENLLRKVKIDALRLPITNWKQSLITMAKQKYNIIITQDDIFEWLTKPLEEIYEIPNSPIHSKQTQIIMKLLERVNKPISTGIDCYYTTNFFWWPDTETEKEEFCVSIHGLLTTETQQNQAKKLDLYFVFCYNIKRGENCSLLLLAHQMQIVIMAMIAAKN